MAFPLGALLKVKSCLGWKVGSDADVVDGEEVLSLELEFPLELPLVSETPTIGVVFGAGMARRPGFFAGKIAGRCPWLFWCGGPGPCGSGLFGAEVLAL